MMHSNDNGLAKVEWDTIEEMMNRVNIDESSYQTPARPVFRVIEAPAVVGPPLRAIVPRNDQSIPQRDFESRRRLTFSRPLSPTGVDDDDVWLHPYAGRRGGWSPSAP
jgi:hypothetical protein